MTVYPLILDLGFLQITGYGIMLMVGFLMAGWAIQRDLAERDLSTEYAGDIVVAAVIGGVLGAKIWYAALYQDVGLMVSRGGMVWYGGFIGGFLAVVLNSIRRKVPVLFTADLCSPGLAVGYALGRVGCFLVQDDYGVPTDVPWGFRFPEGTPPTTAESLQRFGVEVPAGVSPGEVLTVHPTQLYEVVIMLGVFWLLWNLRHNRHGTGWLFGVYLSLAGAERFLIEFIRAKDDRFWGIFTLAQVTSLAIIAAGLFLIARYTNKDEIELPPDAKVLKPA